MSIIPPPNPDAPVLRDAGSGPPVRMKMRGDLTFHLQNYQGVEYWVVKEPLGQKYYQFPPHVFHILKLLDGRRSIDQIIDDYHRTYRPKRITRSELQQLLTRFHKDGLVISDMPGQGTELLERGRKNLAMERVSAMSNILAVRWRGFDPERILNALIPWTWWIFTKPCAIVVGILAMVALSSVLMNFAEFQARLPGFEDFFDPKRWYLFVGVLCVTKVLHEFGHGLSCKRLGGECHEIGFMLLVLTPCLYCNVSDSWRLSNKWHRAAIGAAGMYVEIILATLATFVWWFVQPGLVQDLCLQIMLISSISTVLFNGNPLLRFDGYYIMSDLLEIPNLQQKSSKALTTLLGRHWLGLELPDDPLMPSNRPWAFAMFTIASFFYRWFILFAIVTFLMVWLEPYGLETVGMMIALFAAFGIVLWPAWRLYKFMSVPGRMHQVKKARFFGGLAAAVALLAAILLFPFPHSLRASVIIVPDEMQTVYVDQPGILESVAVQPGETVQPGQTLAVLQNPDLEIALADSEGELLQKENQRRLILQAGTLVESSASYIEELATINSEIASLRRTIAKLMDQRDKLTLSSRIQGTVLETPYRHVGGQSPEIPLVDPQSYLSGRNVGVSLGYRQRFCEVANLSRWQAVVLLTENQIKFAEPGMKTRIKLYLDPGHVIESEVETLGVTDRSIEREDYSNSGSGTDDPTQLPDIVAEMVAASQKAELQYYARVPLPPADPLVQRTPLKIGLGGQARLVTGRRSLGARIWWWFNQNFRF